VGCSVPHPRCERVRAARVCQSEVGQAGRWAGRPELPRPQLALKAAARIAARATAASPASSQAHGSGVHHTRNRSLAPRAPLSLPLAREHRCAGTVPDCSDPRASRTRRQARGATLSSRTRSLRSPAHRGAVSLLEISPPASAARHGAPGGATIQPEELHRRDVSAACDGAPGEAASLRGRGPGAEAPRAHRGSHQRERGDAQLQGGRPMPARRLAPGAHRDPGTVACPTGMPQHVGGACMHA
jgi:hypothetical protein